MIEGLVPDVERIGVSDGLLLRRRVDKNLDPLWLVSVTGNQDEVKQSFDFI